MLRYLITNKNQFIFLLFIKTLSIAILLYFNILLRDFINNISNNLEETTLVRYAIFFIVYIFFLTVVSLISNLFTTRYTNKIMYNLKKDYFNNLIDCNFNTIVSKESSNYISTLTNDINIIGSGYYGAILAILTSLITIICSFVYVIRIEWHIALIMASGALLFFISPIILKKKVDKATLEISDAYKEYVSNIKDILQGVNIIKIYNAEVIAKRRVDNINMKVFKKVIHSSNINIYAGTIVNLVLNLLKILVLVLTAYYIIIQRLDIGAIISIFALSGAFYSPINNIGNQVSNIFSTKQVRKEFFSVLLQKDRKQFKISDNNYNIKLSNLIFSYDGKKNVINDISITFKYGEKYLILGESGGGKSTLLKLLTNLYTPTHGEICIGNIDYSVASFNCISKLITYSQQDTYLFQDSIRNNIDILGDGDLNKLNYCIDVCRLKKFIERQKGGLDAKIGEELNKVSEGEKLRINLARALYKDAPILILDEVTAALDTENAFEIEKKLLSMENHTIISVSHKTSLNTLKMYDYVIVIEGGRIVANEDSNVADQNQAVKKYLLR